MFSFEIKNELLKFDSNEKKQRMPNSCVPYALTQYLSFVENFRFVISNTPQGVILKANIDSGVFRDAINYIKRN